MVKPMLCHNADKPLSYYEKNGFVAERKWDGTRIEVEVIDGKPRIVNRRGIDYTTRLPEITKAFRGKPDCILDGEAVYFDETGNDIFVGSQRRCSTSTPEKIWRLMREFPITFVVFDVREIEGIKLSDEPYHIRKQALMDFLDNEIMNSNVVYSEHREDISAFWKEVLEDGGEGLILKNVNSRYVNERSHSWLKVKKWHFSTVKVVGFTEGNGRNQGLFGALVLVNGKGRHCGKCGGGFTDIERQRLTEVLKNHLGEIRFYKKQPYISTPSLDLKIEVKYHEVTRDGIFRMPHFSRLVKSGTQKPKMAKSLQTWM